MGNTITIAPTQAADYGRKFDGAGAARDETWDQMHANDGLESTINSGRLSADKFSSAAPYRNPVTENNGYANQVAGGANGNQQGAIGLARSLAGGRGPSEAAYQLQSGLDQGLRQQTSIGRSARGGAALATAGSNAGYNRGAMQQNAFTQGGLLRSRDMAQGAGLYGTLAGQQRDQANARLGQATQLNQFNQTANDAYGLQMGGAQVGLGQVGMQASAADQSTYHKGMSPVIAQTNANQQVQGYSADDQNQAIAANIEEDD